MSVTFDATYYLQTYSDVLIAFNNGNLPGATAAEAALYHYNNYGWKELRNPSSGFNTSYYLTANSDVTTSKINPLDHFVAYGAKEGRAPTTALAGTSATFNSTQYLTDNPDVAAAITAGTITNAYQHWVLYGSTEGRTAYNTSGTAISGTTTSGTAYTLTTGVDTITGTSGNDTVTATIVTGTAASTTLNVFDSISLSTGTDTVNVNYGSTAATISSAALPTLTGVEVLALSGVSGASTMVGTIAPSLTTLNQSSPLADNTTMTVTDASATLTTFGLTDITKNGIDQSVTYATGTLSGTSDAVTINLTNAKGTTASAANSPEFALIGPASGSGVETVNLVVASTSALGNLTATDSVTQTMTTLNISGAGAFTDYTALNFKGTSGTINASTNTGGVTLTVSTENLTITGGTGNDTITFDTAGALDASDSVTLGTGTDTVVLADTAVSSSTTALNSAITATGAEVVGFSAAASVNMAYLTATNVAMASTTDVALTVTSLSSTDTIIVNTGTDAAADLSAVGSLGFNTANITLNGGTLASVSIDDVTLTSQGTVNIASNGTLAGTANTLNNLILSDQANVTVTGAQALTITNALENTAVVLNGSAMTGALLVTAGTSASSITGGSANDTITGGTGADTLTGGAGVDTINTGVDGAVGTTISGGTGADLVTSGHVAASAATIAYNATAAESYASSTATGTATLDTLTMANLLDTGTTTVTFTTGVTSSQTGALTVTTTAPTIGTTTVTAYGFVVYNSVVEADGATAGNWFVYQDTDGDGIIEQSEFAIKVVGTTDASDTEAFSVSSGKLVLTMTGA